MMKPIATDTSDFPKLSEKRVHICSAFEVWRSDVEKFCGKSLCRAAAPLAPWVWRAVKLKRRLARKLRRIAKR